VDLRQALEAINQTADLRTRMAQLRNLDKQAPAFRTPLVNPSFGQIFIVGLPEWPGRWRKDGRDVVGTAVG
jgi:hypothetical protein